MLTKAPVIKYMLDSAKQTSSLYVYDLNRFHLPKSHQLFVGDCYKLRVHESESMIYNFEEAINLPKTDLQQLILSLEYMKKRSHE